MNSSFTLVIIDLEGGKFMYTYYLCDDLETIYRISFSIKESDKGDFIALLKKSLSELLVLDSHEGKKLLQEDKVDEENKDLIAMEGSQLFLYRSRVINKEKIEDYLPWIVSVNEEKCSFIRNTTILFLIWLLEGDLDKVNNSLAYPVSSSVDGRSYLDFNLIYNTFFDEDGNVSCELLDDYDSLMELLRSLHLEIDTQYSYSYLSNFWQGDDADRAVADGVVEDSRKNRAALKKLNLSWR